MEVFSEVAADEVQERAAPWVCACEEREGGVDVVDVLCVNLVYCDLIAGEVICAGDEDNFCVVPAEDHVVRA